jgi:Family of unknown function (DUF6510)
MSDQDPTFLDGNAAAGAIAALVAIDITTASGRCEGCGRQGSLADTRVFGSAPGLVVRCAGCDGVLLRLTVGGGRAWLDLRGLSYLEIAAPGTG